MDNIKLWMLSLCGATAITAIFKILLSNSNLKKSLNVFFSIFILFYILTPLNNFTKFNNSYVDLNNFEIDNNKIYQSGYEELIKKSIENICKEMSVSVLEIQIDSNLDDDGNLCINLLEVDIDDNSRIFEIENAINKQLGYEVSVK